MKAARLKRTSSARRSNRVRSPSSLYCKDLCNLQRGTRQSPAAARGKVGAARNLVGCWFAKESSKARISCISHSRHQWRAELFLRLGCTTSLLIPPPAFLNGKIGCSFPRERLCVSSNYDAATFVASAHCATCAMHIVCALDGESRDVAMPKAGSTSVGSGDKCCSDGGSRRREGYEIKLKPDVKRIENLLYYNRKPRIDGWLRQLGGSMRLVNSTQPGFSVIWFCRWLDIRLPRPNFGRWATME